jgi:cytochrome c oxidase cbb3-type subunit 3
MKVRNYLESIANVGIYPVTTLLIFFIFFTLLAIWVLKARKSSYTEISHLPLDSGEVQADTDQIIL